MSRHVGDRDKPESVDVFTELLNEVQFVSKSNVTHNFAMLMQFLEDQ